MFIVFYFFTINRTFFKSLFNFKSSAFEKKSLINQNKKFKLNNTPTPEAPDVYITFSVGKVFGRGKSYTFNNNNTITFEIKDDKDKSLSTLITQINKKPKKNKKINNKINDEIISNFFETNNVKLQIAFLKNDFIDNQILKGNIYINTNNEKYNSAKMEDVCIKDSEYENIYNCNITVQFSKLFKIDLNNNIELKNGKKSIFIILNFSNPFKP